MKISTFLSSLLVLGPVLLAAQETGWKAEESDGAMVRSIIREKNIGGDIERTVASYVVQRSAVGRLDRFEAFMRNADNYQRFIKDIDNSFQARRIANNEWVTYLHWDMPWPLSNSDCVQKMVLERQDSSAFTIHATSDATLYPLQGVDRMELYNAKYDFVQDGEKVHVTITATFALAKGIPKWMIRSWFPEGPADMVNSLINETMR